MITPPQATRVGQAMVRLPKTLPADCTIADARRAFDGGHVHMLLLTRGRTLLGSLVRSDLPGDEHDRDRALCYAVLDGRTISPDESAERARRQMIRSGIRRLAVLDRDGSLLGLLCLKRRQNGFCSDLDVAARAADTARAHSGS